MRVQFIETRVIDDHRKGTPEEERYEQGQAYDLPETSARRWLNRNIAVPISDEVSDILPTAPKRVVTSAKKS